MPKVWTIGELLESDIPEPDYLWGKHLPTDGTSLFTGRAKVGKSTVSTNLFVAVSCGEYFLGRPTKQGKVLYFCAEENERQIKARLRNMDIPDAFKENGKLIFTLPNKTPPNDYLANMIREHNATLAILDTWAKFNRRIKDVNDYAAVEESMDVYSRMSKDLNMHIMNNHHSGHEDRQGAGSGLGSTSFGAGVDTPMKLTKKQDGKRVLSTDQRYGDNIEDEVLYLDKTTDRLSTGGALAFVTQTRVSAEIVELLRISKKNLTREDIEHQVTGKTAEVRKAIGGLVSSNQVRRDGAGKKNEPFTYSVFS